MDLKDIVSAHFTVISSIESINERLRGVHKVISNLKRKLPEVNHLMTYKYLQNYLNEVVYKLNQTILLQKKTI